MKSALANIAKVTLITACILLQVAIHCLAQQSQIQFEHIQLPGGDLSNYINKATQDSDGFMWFSTWNGIHRYDGYSFTNFVHNPADSTSLSANWVETIFIDSDSTLWAGTYGGGLNRFNPDTETFTRFLHEPDNPHSISQDSVTVITEDRLGHLWVGTMGGLNRMDRKTGTFTRYIYDPYDSTSLGNDQVRALYEDSQGTLWVGTNSPFPGERDNPGPGGLNRFDRDSQTFTRYLHILNDPTSVTSNFIASIFEDSRETLWIGTSNYGLATMDRESEIFTRYYYNPDEPIQFTNPPSSPREEYLGVHTIIHEDIQGFIWFGSYGGGLNRYDPNNGEITYFESNPDDPTSLSSNSLWSMSQSRDRTQWITLVPGGINKLYATYSTFNHYSLTPLHSNNSLTALHADRSGILRVNACCPDTGTTVSFKASEAENASYEPLQTLSNSDADNYITIDQLDDGTIWVGAYNGTPSAQTGALFLLDSESNQTTPLFVGTTEDGKQFGPISAIHEDSDGTIWLGTKYTGLFQMNRQTGETIQYSHNPQTNSGLSHASILTIHKSSLDPNILWIGTEGGGLNRFDMKSETFTQYQHEPDNPNSLDGEYITSIHEDNSGTLYIGTRKSGLNVFDKETEQFTQFTEYNSGLSDNNIACMLGDQSGNLWMGTSQGLVRFDPESELFYIYGQNHGVRAQPFIESCDIDIDGQFIFGGMNGFTVFDPADVETDITTAPTIFTNFLLSGQPVLPKPDGILQTPIWRASEVRLPYSDNTFAFEFAVLDYRDPESNQYMYQLQGYDPGWQNAGTQRRASYSQVPYGEYTFRVRSANSMGLWSQEAASIPVLILPPWWQTWWAYGFYALIFAAGVFAVDRVQRRRLIKKEREQARERELEQAREIEKAYQNLEVAHENLKAAQEQLVQQKKLASLGQLTAGIAHEIKNPLNFVNNFSDLSIELVEEVRERIKNSPLLRGESDGGAGARGVSDEATKINSTQKTDLDSTEDNTPLTPLSRGEDILAILDDIATNLKTIHKHGFRADGIIKSMLQHSRGGDGKLEPTDLNMLIKEYSNLAFHGMRAGEDPINVDIKLELDENVGEVEMIAEDFSRVILNICNNAFDAMREKLSAVSSQQSEKSPFILSRNVRKGGSEQSEQGDDSIGNNLSPNPSPGGKVRRGEGEYKPKLTVRTHRNGETVTIEIQDNGPGIPEEIKDKILQPFFTTKKGTAGTGLGLSITNDIVKAHGGQLEIESEKNHYTRFSIHLSNT